MTPTTDEKGVHPDGREKGVGADPVRDGGKGVNPARGSADPGLGGGKEDGAASYGGRPAKEANGGYDWTYGPRGSFSQPNGYVLLNLSPQDDDTILQSGILGIGAPETERAAALLVRMWNYMKTSSTAASIRQWYFKPNNAAVIAAILRQQQFKTAAQYKSVVSSVNDAVVYCKSLAGSSLTSERSLGLIINRLAEVRSRISEAAASTRIATQFGQANSSLRLESQQVTMKKLDEIANVLENGRLLLQESSGLSLDQILSFPGRMEKFISKLILALCFFESIALLTTGEPTFKDLPAKLQEVAEICKNISICEPTYGMIGKFAQGVLHDEYTQDISFLCTKSLWDDGLWKCTVNRANDMVYKSMLFRFDGRDATITLDSVLGSEEKGMRMMIHELLTPGLKGIVSVREPTRAIQTGISYSDVRDNLFGGAKFTASFAGTPLIRFTGIFGVKALCLASGVDCEVDVATKKFSCWNMAMGYDNGEYFASVALQGKLAGFKASIGRFIKSTGTALCAEYTYSEKADQSGSKSSEGHSLTIGLSQELDENTLLKAKVNDSLVVSGLVRRELRTDSYLTISCEVDMVAEKRRPKFGVAVAFKA